jgi:antitoxin CptB
MALPDTQARRLLWRCRRGMKELDLMLERFVRERLACASRAERAAFEKLLTLPDPQLAEYLLGGNTPPEAELALLTGAIRTYVATEASRGYSADRAVPPADAELSGEATV